jgi:hypothetical protein
MSSRDGRQRRSSTGGFRDPLGGPQGIGYQNPSGAAPITSRKRVRRPHFRARHRSTPCERPGGGIDFSSRLLTKLGEHQRNWRQHVTHLAPAAAGPNQPHWGSPNDTEIHLPISYPDVCSSKSLSWVLPAACPQSSQRYLRSLWWLGDPRSNPPTAAMQLTPCEA